MGSASHRLQTFPALTPVKFEFRGRVAECLMLTPKLLMHALVTDSLLRMKAFIEAIQPFTVECLNNRPVCSHARLIEAFTFTRAQEL